MRELPVAQRPAAREERDLARRPRRARARSSPARGAPAPRPRSTPPTFRRATRAAIRARAGSGWPPCAPGRRGSRRPASRRRAAARRASRRCARGAGASRRSRSPPAETPACRCRAWRRARPRATRGACRRSARARSCGRAGRPRRGGPAACRSPRSCRARGRSGRARATLCRPVRPTTRGRPGPRTSRAAGARPPFPAGAAGTPSRARDTARAAGPRPPARAFSRTARPCPSTASPRRAGRPRRRSARACPPGPVCSAMQSAGGIRRSGRGEPSTVSPSSTSTSGSGVFASRSRSEARRRMHAARRRFASVLPKLRPTTTMSCVAASPGTKSTVTSRAIQPSDGPGASTLRYGRARRRASGACPAGAWRGCGRAARPSRAAGPRAA